METLVDDWIASFTAVFFFSATADGSDARFDFSKYTQEAAWGVSTQSEGWRAGQNPWAPEQAERSCFAGGAAV